MKRNERGMVTAELAMAALAVAVIAAALVGVFGLLVVQLRCIDGAAEIARQAARGDTAAIERVSGQLPRDASVRMERPDSTTVQVTVSAPVRPIPGLPAEVTVVGQSTTRLEPGVR